MNEVRESFIIYSSFYRPISKLSDRQLGRLFRAIFQYNLGEVVSVEEDIEMAFGFFVNQFEIDEAKYQSKVVENRENGRKGGNPNFKRGQKNPYYQQQKITEDNPGLCKDNQDNPGLCKDNQDNPGLCKDNQDNRGLSKITPHNPNDNDNDNDNENDLPPNPPRGSGAVEIVADVDELREKFTANAEMMSDLQRDHGLSPETLQNKLSEFLRVCKHSQDMPKTVGVLYKRFNGWLNFNANENSPTNRLDRRRGTDATGVKPKNYTTSF
jgi:hypothetical protein